MSKSIQKKYGFELPFVTDPLVRRAIRFCRGEKVLDLGCGEGADSVFFAKKGFQVTSVDKNEQYQQRLRAYCQDEGVANIQTVLENALSFSYPADTYDVVSSILLICCMRRSEVEKILPLIRQTVKPGGVLILSARNYLDPDLEESLANEEQVEPNTFRSKKDCCAFTYYLEKDRLRECFADFDILFYYEGYAPCKYKEHPRHGDSMIICRRKNPAG